MTTMSYLVVIRGSLVHPNGQSPHCPFTHLILCFCVIEDWWFYMIGENVMNPAFHTPFENTGPFRKQLPCQFRITKISTSTLPLLFVRCECWRLITWLTMTSKHLIMYLFIIEIMLYNQANLSITNLLIQLLPPLNWIVRRSFCFPMDSSANYDCRAVGFIISIKCNYINPQYIWLVWWLLVYIVNNSIADTISCLLPLHKIPRMTFPVRENIHQQV